MELFCCCSDSCFSFWGYSLKKKKILKDIFGENYVWWIFIYKINKKSFHIWKINFYEWKVCYFCFYKTKMWKVIMFWVPFCPGKKKKTYYKNKYIWA
jgi:hypothetical protein